MLTQKRLKEVLRYNPRTGLFFPVRRRRGVRFGVPAGAKSSALGYIIICVDRTHYYAHRLAWLYINGSFPKHDIDHKNCMRDDNRWANLRSATRQQNRCNSRNRCDNSSGYKGVSKHIDGRWRARITANGKDYHIGCYRTPKEAFLARKSATVDLHREFGRTG